MNWKPERQWNINHLNRTLSILEQGLYAKDGVVKYLKLDREDMKAAQVFLPEEIAALQPADTDAGSGRCILGCENTDAYSLARRLKEDDSVWDVLVLNLANPVNPGGGVRKGSKAQEEDLCRTSSLLLSLESDSAKRYYEYNRSLNTYMGSDAIIITPRVEVIRDEKGELLDYSEILSVMTCAAPMLIYGLEGMTVPQYIDMMHKRITGMLRVAAGLGYRTLVLGAFGCGAFRNDARVVSDIFSRAIREFRLCGKTMDDLFDQIHFAVLDHTPDQYNFKEFNRNFGRPL